MAKAAPMDARAVLAVADEIERAEQAALEDFVPKDGADAIGAAYAAGAYEVIDHGWADALRGACAQPAGRESLSLALDMAAFSMAAESVAVSDMLSDLAQAVKHGGLEGFKERWLKE